MGYAYGFAVLTVFFLFTGFAVNTANVSVAQFFFVLSAVAAVVGTVVGIEVTFMKRNKWSPELPKDAPCKACGGTGKERR